MMNFKENQVWEIKILMGASWSSIPPEMQGRPLALGHAKKAFRITKRRGSIILISWLKGNHATPLGPTEITTQAASDLIKIGCLRLLYTVDKQKEYEEILFETIKKYSSLLLDKEERDPLLPPSFPETLQKPRGILASADPSLSPYIALNYGKL